MRDTAIAEQLHLDKKVRLAHFWRSYGFRSYISNSFTSASRSTWAILWNEMNFLHEQRKADMIEAFFERMPVFISCKRMANIRREEKLQAIEKRQKRLFECCMYELLATPDIGYNY